MGNLFTIRERRLIRESEDDRIIAIIEAPPGTRIRRRRDEHGLDQLIVPVGRSLWARLLARPWVIPAKYVIGKARLGESGLRLVAVPKCRKEAQA